MKYTKTQQSIEKPERPSVNEDGDIPETIPEKANRLLKRLTDVNTRLSIIVERVTGYSEPCSTTDQCVVSDNLSAVISENNWITNMIEDKLKHLEMELGIKP